MNYTSWTRITSKNSMSNPASSISIRHSPLGSVAMTRSSLRHYMKTIAASATPWLLSSLRERLWTFSLSFGRSWRSYARKSKTTQRPTAYFHFTAHGQRTQATSSQSSASQRRMIILSHPTSRRLSMSRCMRSANRLLC